MQRLVRNLYKTLDQVNAEGIPDGMKALSSFEEFLSEIKKGQFDARTFAISLKATVCN